MENKIIEASVRDIDVVTSEIVTLKRNAQNIMLYYAIEIGKRLKEAKGLLDHGEWGNWLKEKVDFSQSSANNFMKLFDEYGSKQIDLFGQDVNSQTIGNLSYTKALKLLAIPEEERENFAKDNDVENISTRELDKLIKERDEALKKAEEVDALNKRIAELEAGAETEDKESLELKKQIDELKINLEKVQTAEKKAKEKIKALKENPEIPKEVLDKITLDAEEKARKGAEATSEKLKEKIEELEEKQRQSEQFAKEAKEEADRLKKQLLMASPYMTEFKTLFNQVQKAIVEMNGVIERMTNEEEKAKCAKAIAALAEKLKG